MKVEWEFAMQKENGKQWRTLTKPNAIVGVGKYRIVARIGDRDASIRTTIERVGGKETIAWEGKTDGDGKLGDLPTIDFEAGLWRLTFISIAADGSPVASQVLQVDAIVPAAKPAREVIDAVSVVAASPSPVEPPKIDLVGDRRQVGFAATTVATSTPLSIDRDFLVCLPGGSIEIFGWCNLALLSMPAATIACDLKTVDRRDVWQIVKPILERENTCFSFGLAIDFPADFPGGLLIGKVSLCGSDGSILASVDLTIDLDSEEPPLSPSVSQSYELAAERLRQMNSIHRSSSSSTNYSISTESMPVIQSGIEPDERLYLRDIPFRNFDGLANTDSEDILEEKQIDDRPIERLFATRKPTEIETPLEKISIDPLLRLSDANLPLPKPLEIDINSPAFEECYSSDVSAKIYGEIAELLDLNEDFLSAINDPIPSPKLSQQSPPSSRSYDNSSKEVFWRD
jgi:hypothetical protein